MLCVSEIGNVVFSQIGLSSYSQSFFLFCSTCAENLRAGRISSRNIFTHAISGAQCAKPYPSTSASSCLSSATGRHQQQGALCSGGATLAGTSS